MSTNKNMQMFIQIVVSAICAVVLGLLMLLTPMFPSSWVGFFYVGIFHSLLSAVVPNVIAVWIISFCIRILLSWICALIGRKKRAIGLWCEVVLSILNIGYTVVLFMMIARF